MVLSIQLTEYNQFRKKGILDLAYNLKTSLHTKEEGTVVFHSNII